MPWLEIFPMDQRTKLVADAQRELYTWVGYSSA